MSDKLTPIDQWGELNKILRNSRFTNIGLVVVSSLVSICLLWQMFRPPVVIQVDKSKHDYFRSRYENVTISNDDAIQFIKNFVRRRYAWKQFSPAQVVAEVTPLVTDEFARVLKKSLANELEKMVKVKSIEQNVTNIEVKIDDGKALATFDKVIRVNGMPLVAPTQISLLIVKKDQTGWNPMGLYVHGLVEHSED